MPLDLPLVNDVRPYTRRYSDGSCIFVRASIFDRKFRALSIAPGRINIDDWNSYLGGAHIQAALSALTPEEREFILTGSTPEQWDTLKPEDEPE